MSKLRNRANFRTATLAAKRVRVGRIGAAHGIRGEVRLFVDADDPLDVKKLGALEDEAGALSFRIVALREGKGHLVARFEGVNDRTAAERLTNIELYVPRERLPKQKDKDTFYQADLVGLRVESADGEQLGTLQSVQNFGAGDILEISPPDGRESFMIPFLDRFVPKVDIDGGRIVVELPEDLLESSSRPSRATRGESRDP